MASQIHDSFQLGDKDLVSLMIERSKEGPLKDRLYKRLTQNTPLDSLCSEIQQEFPWKENRIEIERNIHKFNDLSAGLRKTCAHVLDLVRELGTFAKDEDEREEIEENAYRVKMLSLLPPKICEDILVELEREDDWRPHRVNEALLNKEWEINKEWEDGGKVSREKQMLQKETKELEELEQKMRKSEMQRSMKMLTLGQPACNHCGSNRHNIDTCPRVDPTTCWACGDSGHLRINCPYNWQRIQCFNCGENGHLARDCQYIGYPGSGWQKGGYESV